MRELIQNLHKINQMNLSAYPVEQINNYLKNLGSTAQIGYTLHKGFDIYRARPNDDEDTSFTSRSQLSYKPQKYNSTFQRASTPSKTMFYGSLLPTEFGEDDINNARATSCFEASRTFRQNLLLSNEKITFGRWQVQKDINVMLILPNEVNSESKDTFVGFMNSELSNYLQTKPEIIARTKIVNKYFGDIFSNQNIRHDFDYIVSALYTEKIVNAGFDGIIYPSVKAQGKGYNICLTPECIDEKMSLIAAGECRILRVGYQSIVVGESEVLIENDNLPFKYERVKDYREPSEIVNELYKLYNLK